MKSDNIGHTKSFRTLSNSLATVKLSLGSVFHGTVITYEAYASKLELGLIQLKSFLEKPSVSNLNALITTMAEFPVTPLKYYLEGRKLRKAYLNPAVAADPMQEAMKAAAEYSVDQARHTEEKEGLQVKSDNIGYILGALTMSGITIAVGFLITRLFGIDMRFFISTIFLLWLGRKLGWFLSRHILYTAPTGVSLIILLFWGGAIASIIHVLIQAFHPNIVLKIIMGYLLGAYVADPAFGLFVEGSIPPEALPRSLLITWLPVIVYIMASVGLSYS